MQRRRNSFRLLLFFSCQGVISLLMFLGGTLIYIIIYGSYHIVPKDCITDEKITSNGQLMNTTLRQKESIICKNSGGSEEVVGGACDRADMEAVFKIMLASGVVAASHGVASAILAFAYRMFTNLPTELLQHGKVGFMSRCFGGICKMLPWWNRLIHIVQLGILLGLWYMVMTSYCKGEFHKVWNCRNYFSNCAYNKLKNCRYYYHHCEVNTELFENCWVAEERSAFSGRMDIRLLTHDACTRCEVLKSDFNLATEDDAFFLLEESDRGTENWKCKDDADSCFSTGAFSAIACSCAQTAADILSAEAITALKGTCANAPVPAPAAGGRRLQDIYNITGPLPCWLGNATACPSLLRKESRVFASHKASAARSWPTHFSHGRELQGNGTANGAGSGGATGNGTGTGGNVNPAEPANTTAAPTEPAPTLAPVVQADPITEQQCGWGPSQPEDYWFGAEDCFQQGSFMYRTALLYLYLAVCTWLAVTFIGQIVRVTSRPEPWFFQPQAPNEGRFWKLCRLLGP